MNTACPFFHAPCPMCREQIATHTPVQIDVCAAEYEAA
jgi:hypothetical protein